MLYVVIPGFSLHLPSSSHEVQHSRAVVSFQKWILPPSGPLPSLGTPLEVESFCRILPACHRSHGPSHCHIVPSAPSDATLELPQDCIYLVCFKSSLQRLPVREEGKGAGGFQTSAPGERSSGSQGAVAWTGSNWLNLGFV